MRWLAVTLALLGASVALVAGIYLRDRDTSWRPPERATADFDAQWLLLYLAGPACGNRCGYRLLGHPQTNHWLAWINDRSRTQCVDINVGAFQITTAHGVLGVTRIPCDARAAGFDE